MARTPRISEQDYLNLVKCKNCNLVYTNPLFDEEHYKEIYQSEEYQNIVKDLGESSHIYRKERFEKGKRYFTEIHYSIFYG